MNWIYYQILFYCFCFEVSLDLWPFNKAGSWGTERDEEHTNATDGWGQGWSTVSETNWGELKIRTELIP